MTTAASATQTVFFYGKREHFALSFTFDASDSTEPYEDENTASWGHLQVWVDGINLCAHLENGETVNSISWYALPLLEWLGEQWDAIFHEQKIPLPDDAATLLTQASFAADALAATALPPMSYKTEQQLSRWEEAWYGWFSRHALAHPLAGAIAPDLIVRRWRDTVEFSWTAHKPHGTPADFRFIYTSGGRRLEPQLVSQAAFDFVHDCTDYLMRIKPGATRLRKLKKKIVEIQHSESEHGKRYAYLAGLGATPSALQKNWSHFVGEVKERRDLTQLRALIDYKSDAKILPGTGVATLMFGCLSPTITQADLETLTEQLLIADQEHPTELFLELASRQVLREDVRPWKQGYDLALETLGRLRQHVKLDGQVPIADVLSKLRIPVRHIYLLDNTIRGISVAHYTGGPTFVLLNMSDRRNETDAGSRFTLAHEFAHLLFDRDNGLKMAVASGPWAPPDIEKRANAFAAMFLMPPDLIEQLVRKHKTWTTSRISELSAKFGCGYVATREHLLNLGYLSPSDSQKLEDQGAEPFID